MRSLKHASGGTVCQATLSPGTLHWRARGHCVTTLPLLPPPPPPPQSNIVLPRPYFATTLTTLTSRSVVHMAAPPPEPMLRPPAARCPAPAAACASAGQRACTTECLGQARERQDWTKQGTGLNSRCGAGKWCGAVVGQACSTRACSGRGRKGVIEGLTAGATWPCTRLRGAVRCAAPPSG